jgi:hypothetical protein
MRKKSDKSFDFCHPGDILQCLETFSKLDGGINWPGIQLNDLQCLGIACHSKTYSTPDGNTANIGKSCFLKIGQVKGMGFIR